MSKVSHLHCLLFEIYAPKQMKCLFTNIEKESNMLKSILPFEKNTNFTGK